MKVTKQQAERLIELYSLHGGSDDGMVWVCMQDVLKCLGIRYWTKAGDWGLVIDEACIAKKDDAE